MHFWSHLLVITSVGSGRQSGASKGAPIALRARLLVNCTSTGTECVPVRVCAPLVESATCVVRLQGLVPQGKDLALVKPRWQGIIRVCVMVPHVYTGSIAHTIQTRHKSNCQSSLSLSTRNNRESVFPNAISARTWMFKIGAYTHT
eukprot:3715208-Amphidinium_carterae.1